MREHLMALAASIREASEAIRSRDLPRLQQAALSQQQLLNSIAADRRTAFGLLLHQPQLTCELASASAFLSRIIQRSEGTVQALLAISQTANPLYSLEFLPRR